MRWVFLILILASCKPSKVIYLDGSKSYSPEGSPITYEWRLLTDYSRLPFFTGTYTTLSIKPGLYAFELTVTDTLGFKGKDTAYIKY